MQNWIKQHPWKSLILALLAIFIVTLPILLQTSVKQAVYQYTHPYGIEKVELEDIDLNLFKGTLQLNNLRLLKTTENQLEVVTNIKALEVDLALLQLLKQRVVIKKLIFHDAHLPFSLDEQAQLSLAGIPLTSDDTSPEKENKKGGTAIEFGIESLEFKEIQLSLEHKKQLTTLKIESLTLTDLQTWSNTFARLILKASLNEHPLAANLQLHLFRKQPKIIGTFKSSDIKIAEFEHFIPQSILESGMKFDSTIHTDLTFTAEQTKAGFKLFQQGPVTIDQPYFKQDKTNIKLDKIIWDGDVYVTQKEQTNLILDGDLSLNGTNFDQETLKASVQSLKASGKTELNLTETVNITLQQNLAIEQAVITPSDTMRLSTNINLQTDSQIKLSAEQTQIKHKGQLNLTKLEATQKKLKALIEKVQSAGSAEIVLKENAQINLNQIVNVIRLAVKDGDQALDILADIELTSNSQITAGDKDTNLKHNGSLKVANVRANLQDLSAKLKSVQWQGNAAVFSSTQADAKTDISSSGQLSLENLNLTNLKQKTELASLQSLSADSIRVLSVDHITSEKLSLNALTIGGSNKDKALSYLQNLTLNQAEYKATNQGGAILLGNIVLTDSQTNISLNKDNQITQIENLLAAINQQSSTTDSSPQTEKPANKSEQAAAEKPAFNYSIQSVAVKGKNAIQLQTAEPPITKTMHLENFSLTGLNSESPNKTSKYDLAIRFDEFSKLESKGSITPLNPSHHVNADTEIESFSLLDVSHLSEQTIGYFIKSGQLSGEFKTKLQDNLINSENKVSINKLEVEPGATEEAKKRQAGFPVPLQTGIAMLQDKNDNIDLSIPVKGDISSPDFDIGGVINIALGKAMAGATRTYLLLALQPFGALALAGEMAIDKAGAISLESVVFAEGSEQITPKMQQYLAKISKLLKERKGIQIKLCDGSSEAERLALKQQQIKQSIEKQNAEGVSKIKVPDINITDEELLALAIERQKVIKRALIKLGVDSKQVILCKPQILKGNKKPGVSLKI